MRIVPKMSHRVGWILVPVALACGGRVGDDTSTMAGRGGTFGKASGGTSNASGGTIGTTAGSVLASGGSTLATASGGTAGTASFGCDLCQCPELIQEASSCGIVKTAAWFGAANVLFVLDKSASMNATPDGYTKTKWAVLVDSFMVALQQSAPQVRYGMLLYPNAREAASLSCEVAAGESAVNIGVGPAADCVPRINSLLASTIPSGGTPTAAALRSVLDYYTVGAGTALEGTKHVVLITDGGPNCNAELTCDFAQCTANVDRTGSCGMAVANCCDPTGAAAGRPSPTLLCLDDASTLAAIQALHLVGVRTFVIALPGSEPYADYLDQFATAGGVPLRGLAHKYYSVAAESSLPEALTSIATSLVRQCEVPLLAPPADSNALNIAIDCSPIPQQSGGVANWVYDASSQSIVLLNAECENLRAHGAARVDVLNDCLGGGIL